MARQKEERQEELETLRKVFMEGVKEQMKEQITLVREEMRAELSAVRNDVQDKVEDLGEKQKEISDVQSILDCRVDKLEEELKKLKQVPRTEINDTDSEPDKETLKLIDHAAKVVGFKPIEARDISRLMRMENIEDEEEAKKECLKEYWRCELRMPVESVNELLNNIVKVWHPEDEDEWDKLYVEFQDAKYVKICYSYCKFMRNKDSQILQYIPSQFRDQCRTLHSISYQLRKPEDPSATKFKTRLRFGKSGLELQKRHPDQKNWTKVPVHHLPPVDLNPVPPPSARDSPPLVRARDRKRPRSPQQSESPPSSHVGKREKIAEEHTKRPVEEHSGPTYDISNVGKAFQFQNLVDRFAGN